MQLFPHTLASLGTLLVGLIAGTSFGVLITALMLAARDSESRPEPPTDMKAY